MATTVEHTTFTQGGRRYHRFVVAGESVGLATEIELAGVPQLGTVVMFRATYAQDGTATAIAPIMGRVTGWTEESNDAVMRSCNLVADYFAWDNRPRPYVSDDDQRLFLLLQPNNAATDCTIDAEIVIVEGFPDGYDGLPVNESGFTEVSLGDLIAGEDVPNDRMKVEHQYSPYRASGAATYVIKSGSGFLHAITVNSTAAGTITVYDNTAGSGTVLAQLKASVGERTYLYDIAFTTGLTIVMAAASDITVSYR